METVTDFLFSVSKINVDGDCSYEIKRHLLFGRKAITNLNSVLKSTDITLLTKVHIVKAMVFPVVMYGCKSWTIKKFSSVAQSCQTLCDPMDCRTPVFLVHQQLLELAQTHVHQVSDAIQPSHPLSSPSPPALNLSQHQGRFQRVFHKEDWAPKNRCFQILVLEKTLENPVDYKEIKPVNPKGNRPWIFIGRTDVEGEAPTLWPPYVKSWPWCWGRLRARGEGGDRGWDGWMASLTQWTWVWANSRR